MSAKSTPTRRSKASPPHAWCYASGRVAALESEWIPASEFESLARRTSVAEARAALGKTRYRGAFATDEAVKDFVNALAAIGERENADLLAVCPPHVMAEFLALPGRYLAFRALFLRRCEREPRVEELDEAFSALADTADTRAALEEHRDMLRRRDPPQTADAVARSLFLDGAGARVALALAQSAPEPEARRFMLDHAALRAWACARRAVWNGAPASEVERWMVVGGEWEGLPIAAAASERMDAVAPWLSREAADRLAAQGEERARKDIDAAVDAVTGLGARDLRLAPFGAGRVLSYLESARQERLNLRIALSAPALGVDPAAALEGLRTTYV
ncbi:MAG TPA: V-type ATPase subunit [Candidatus Brocadiia bacterium]|nr:V-type ATPase subunit [Candidatus Brocadiia bacterium]